MRCLAAQRERSVLSLFFPLLEVWRPASSLFTTTISSAPPGPFRTTPGLCPRRFDVACLDRRSCWLLRPALVALLVSFHPPVSVVEGRRWKFAEQAARAAPRPTYNLPPSLTQTSRVRVTVPSCLASLGPLLGNVATKGFVRELQKGLVSASWTLSNDPQDSSPQSRLDNHLVPLSSPGGT